MVKSQVRPRSYGSISILYVSESIEGFNHAISKYRQYYLPFKLFFNFADLDSRKPRLIGLIRHVCRLECHFVPNVILEAKLLLSIRKELSIKE